jgi:NAD(P) transhydrogenase subunit alpha
MKIAVPKETGRNETRVALAPETVKKLVKAGIEVVVEQGAGVRSHYDDAAYREAGAALEADPAAVYAAADLLLRVQCPGTHPTAGRHEADMLREGAMLLGGLLPTRNLDAMKRLAARRVTAFSTDAIPRTTRAQAMDTLSSQANIAGYRAVLIAAEHLPRLFPMFMTAAGTVFASKVFVIGAGVAGLQAIATAKRLGAQVTATDVRPEVKEQIESVGAKYVGIELGQAAQAGGGYAKELSAEDAARQRAVLVEHCSTVDAIITTALIGGVFAPKIITAEMVRKMKPGAVIVDLAADGGGNCELTRPGEIVEEGGVKIVGPVNLPAGAPFHASLLFGRNLFNFVMAFWKEKEKTFNLDWGDEILAKGVITHEGEVKHGPTRDALAKM